MYIRIDHVREEGVNGFNVKKSGRLPRINQVRILLSAQSERFPHRRVCMPFYVRLSCVLLSVSMCSVKSFHVDG